jgi:hypothetical protein
MCLNIDRSGTQDGNALNVGDEFCNSHKDMMFILQVPWIQARVKPSYTPSLVFE